MNQVFEIVCGSCRGREHERLSVNCQDAVQTAAGPGWMAAVVCDGCGSAGHSEVGAKLGAALVIRLLEENLAQGERDPETILSAVREESLLKLRTVAGMLSGDKLATVNDYLLFTVLGIAVTPRRTFVFSHGDGLFALNGEEKIIDWDNRPPYLSYGLVPELVDEDLRGELKFRLEADLETRLLQSAMIGTDGMRSLRDVRQDDPRREAAESLRTPWCSDSLFKNPFAAGRQLRLLGKEHVRLDWERKRALRTKGLFTDDASFVAVRRRTESEVLIM